MSINIRNAEALDQYAHALVACSVSTDELQRLVNNILGYGFVTVFEGNECINEFCSWTTEQLSYYSDDGSWCNDGMTSSVDRDAILTLINKCDLYAHVLWYGWEAGIFDGDD